MNYVAGLVMSEKLDDIKFDMYMLRFKIQGIKLTDRDYKLKNYPEIRKQWNAIRERLRKYRNVQFTVE